MRTGFIGLGNLGKAIAGRLISEGVELTVWNRTRSKAERLKVATADTPAALISQVDIVFVCLFDSAAVESVMAGPEGLLSGKCRGKIIVDLTTNHFDAVGAFNEAAEEQGVAYLESPVLGSVVPAAKGMLTIVVSGDEQAYKRAHPYLSKFGKDIYYLGRPALASKMKVINNLVLGTFMAVISEAVVLGEEIGLEKAQVLDILSSGAGHSGVLDAKRTKLQTEDFSPHFSVAAIYKDLQYLQDLSQATSWPLFTGNIVKELYGLAQAAGMADMDFSSVYQLLKGRKQ
ncbi:MAG: NAD(P)-dependent oxidoreductase [candidate division Zixibacteria bacterium]|nr:NAD(P)-dependent oxidoreductase [candidate division Zixibacteria bacterium]